MKYLRKAERFVYSILALQLLILVLFVGVDIGYAEGVREQGQNQVLLAASKLPSHLFKKGTVR